MDQNEIREKVRKTISKRRKDELRRRRRKGESAVTTKQRKDHKDIIKGF